MATTMELLNAAQIAVLANRPSVTLTLTATQAVTTSTNTQVAWSSASGDNWVGWSSSSATRYTVQLAGWYRLAGTVMWAGNATGARHAEFYQNGVENTNSLTVWNASPGSQQFPHATNPVIVQAAVGDYFQMNVWQSSGGSLNIMSVSTMTVDFVRF